MYYGGPYCPDCKYNRDCYMTAANPYNDPKITNCRIMHDIFKKEYFKVNNKKGNK